MFLHNPVYLAWGTKSCEITVARRNLILALPLSLSPSLSLSLPPLILFLMESDVEGGIDIVMAGGGRARRLILSAGAIMKRGVHISSF